MTHYLLLQFHPGHMSDELFTLAQSTYAELSRQVPGIDSAQVYRNCVPRSFNADLMVRIEFHRQEDLRHYLEHPLHQSFAGQIELHLLHRISFDCT